MRILHTSDWHLGRRIHGSGTEAAHAAFIDWLTALVADRGIDAVLVSGDVYDRAIPHPDALALWDRATSALLTAGARIIATSGNHDSFIRLGVGRRQLDGAGLHLCTRLSDIVRPVRLDYEGRELAPDDPEPGVSFHGIPYLEPALVWERLGAAARTHTAVLTAAMDRIGAVRPERDRLIVLAHAFVAGSAASDSERDISVGGVGLAPLSVFANCDYAALGHVHRPHDLAAHVRYSGSPLPFSFGEEDTPKRVVEIELTGPDSAPVLTDHAVPELLRLRTLSGTLEGVLAAAHEHADALVSVELTDPGRVPGALERLRQAFPGFIRMSWTGLAERPVAPVHTAASAAARTDTEVFGEFYETQRGIPAPAHALERFESALAQVLSQAESGGRA
ncbi:exonuclease SbcCD subunit D [Brevibacterium album]|uniref:exonuclease SbcCD subunit D n=1 Tax=Brevibacterium album TaxID=417948 RepID=UPI00041432E3|nr:exonuclease SbcCD subunit D [Brevibacterium album]